jgi:hypothetical protein
MKLSALCVAILSIIGTAAANAATLLGQNAKGGESVEVRFPVAPYFQQIAAQNNNPLVETGRAVLMFPPGFDPSRKWPILIVTSTTDFGRTSPMDAEQWYRRPANAEGWVVFASDATIKPRVDSTPWRLAMLAAALDALHKEWPQTKTWPVAFAGFSGGAKRSALLGAMLAKSGAVKPRGFFLSGINDDKMTEGYRNYSPGRDYLNVPVWLSSGTRDNIARPMDHDRVHASMIGTGFKRVRLERFDGRHQLQMSHVRLALQWFRQVGGF